MLSLATSVSSSKRPLRLRLTLDPFETFKGLEYVLDESTSKVPTDLQVAHLTFPAYQESPRETRDWNFITSAKERVSTWWTLAVARAMRPKRAMMQDLFI